MRTYNCTYCQKIFKRYPSLVVNPNQVFCSKACYSQAQKENQKGEKNPNFRHGIYSVPSICQCGAEKDFRATQCALCAKRGFPKDTELDQYDLALITDVIKRSRHFCEAAQRLQVKRSWVQRFTEVYQISTKHFIPGRRRPGTQEQYLKKGSTRSNQAVKSLLLREKLLEYKCAACGLKSEWHNKVLNLELDHINGDGTDNRLQNLRFLCPNCHSQTETYCGRQTRCRKK